MPNRVDANISGVRPEVARRPTEQQADAATQAPQAANAREGTSPNQVDRVEISPEAQAQQALAAPNAGGGTAPTATETGAVRPQEAGEDNAVAGATAQRAEQLRDQQETTRQQNAGRSPEQPGNLVDVTG
ncbi:MAG: hypothetical protein QGI83_13870 [Candidatus Latescibacteria bacterium]|jgi:hypothetical protein|nr:hypothetical protein [Candidatus Latescibacterota bacterium]